MKHYGQREDFGNKMGDCLIANDSKLLLEIGGVDVDVYEIIISGKTKKVADLSKWQGDVNFQMMKDYGIEGVILKAGQGLREDPKFQANKAGALAVGLPVGTYFFYDPLVDASLQGEFWAGLLVGYNFRLPHFGDYEANWSGNWSGIGWFKQFFKAFLLKSGLPDSKVGVYTGYYFWLENGNTDPYWARFWLWIAWYTTNPSYVKIPAPWVEAQLIMWQYTGNANGWAAGTQSDSLDLNEFLNEELFNQMTGGTTMPEPTNTIYTLEVLVNLNGRDAPSGNLLWPAGSTLSTGFKPGDIITATVRQGNWFQPSNLVRNGADATQLMPAGVWCFAGDNFLYAKIVSEVVITDGIPHINITLTNLGDGKVWNLDADFTPQ